MDVNGETTHDTVPQTPYAKAVTGNWWRLTRKGAAVYATLLLPNAILPAAAGRPGT